PGGQRWCGQVVLNRARRRCEGFVSAFGERAHGGATVRENGTWEQPNQGRFGCSRCPETSHWLRGLCSGSGDRKRMSQDIGNAFVLMLLHVKSSVGDHGGGDRGQVTGRGGARLRRLEGLGFEAHCSLSRGRRSGV